MRHNKYLIEEDWEEEAIRDIIGDEELYELKGRLEFDPEIEYLQIEITAVPK